VGQAVQQQATGQQFQPQPQLVGQPLQPRQRASQARSFLTPARVNQVITENVVTAERDTPIQTIVAQMAENDVGSVIVVDDERPIGIITDRKVAMALEEMPDIAQHTAEELVHGELVTADPSMSIFDALDVMSAEGIRRLPIVDDDGALRGIVTLDDVLVLLGGVFGRIADTIEAQSPRF